jgi:hypothetical protein
LRQRSTCPVFAQGCEGGVDVEIQLAFLPQQIELTDERGTGIRTFSLERR